LLYYTPSMALCNICIHHIHVVYAGGRIASGTAIESARKNPGKNFVLFVVYYYQSA
jgi:hypothetical protein